MISFARMNRILEIDLDNERAVVEPGVVNLDITLAVQGTKFFYAPDPSSQRACTIGGNVAENAGGPHTLAYGVTTNHVLGMEARAAGWVGLHTGGKEQDLPGYDLTGLLTGSEGTMVLVTKIVSALDATAGAGEDDARDLRLGRATAGNTVAEITARAITPVAVEMLDGVMLRMVEEATHAGYPMDAAAGAARLNSRACVRRWRSRWSKFGKPAMRATRASFGWRATPRSGICSGRAARTPLALSAA